jgi:hypothetical protein
MVDLATPAAWAALRIVCMTKAFGISNHNVSIIIKKALPPGSAPVPLGYLDNRSYAEHKKDRGENSVIHSPGKTCTKERQRSK